MNPCLHEQLRGFLIPKIRKRRAPRVIEYQRDSLGQRVYRHAKRSQNKRRYKKDHISADNYVYMDYDSEDNVDENLVRNGKGIKCSSFLV